MIRRGVSQYAPTGRSKPRPYAFSTFRQSIIAPTLHNPIRRGRIEPRHPCYDAVERGSSAWTN